MKNGLVIDEYGHRWWYKDDELHREDGPAIEYTNGDKSWYQNGLRHRLDGPAIEYSDGEEHTVKWYNGNKIWYYKDKRIICSTNEEFLRLIKLLAFL
jgi:hypothetical protein